MNTENVKLIEFLKSLSYNIIKINGLNMFLA